MTPDQLKQYVATRIADLQRGIDELQAISVLVNADPKLLDLVLLLKKHGI